MISRVIFDFFYICRTYSRQLYFCSKFFEFIAHLTLCEVFVYISNILETLSVL